MLIKPLLQYIKSLYSFFCVEGGPQAITECGITKTPIISTNVGMASKF